jgi:hypothetical protein
LSLPSRLGCEAFRPFRFPDDSFSAFCDEIVAAMIMRRDARRLEMLNLGFDVRFLRFQFSHLLKHVVMSWASIQQLDADLRMGAYLYRCQLRSELWSVTSGHGPFHCAAGSRSCCAVFVAGAPDSFTPSRWMP